MPCIDPCDCPENNFTGVGPPGATDDNCDTSGNGTFCPMSMWLDTLATPPSWYINVDATCGTSQWDAITGRETLTHWRGAVTSPPQSVPAGNFTTKMDVNEVGLNPNLADNWDNGTKTFTVGNTGFYMFSGSALTIINNNAGRWFEGPFIQLLVYVNSVFRVPIFIKQPVEYIRNVDSQIQGVGASTVQLNSGDLIQVFISHRLGQTIDLVDDAGSFSRNEWAIDRLPDYQPL